MTSTAEKSVGTEEVETDIDLDEDVTSTADKNTVPLEESIAGPTAAVYKLEWIIRYVPMDTM